MPTEPKAGDMVIFQGKLFWLSMTITLTNGKVQFLLRQAHWPQGFHLLVNRDDVLIDPPIVA